MVISKLTRKTDEQELNPGLIPIPGVRYVHYYRSLVRGQWSKWTYEKWTRVPAWNYAATFHALNPAFCNELTFAQEFDGFKIETKIKRVFSPK